MSPHNIPQKLKQHPLATILCIGFILRLAFLFASQHYYYPDEIYQTLEPAYRLVHGYGLIPWDYSYGLRSWLVPGILALPLALSNLLSLTQPAHYLTVFRLTLILLSLAPIAAGYLLIHHLTQKKTLAIIAAVSLAIWYELIYFAPRPFTETLSVAIFALSLITYLAPTRKHLPPRWQQTQLLLASFLATLGVFIRPQYLLIGGALLFWFWLRQRHLRVPIAIAAFAGAGIIGLTDALTYGTWWVHLINNVTISYHMGISQIFGSKPWWFYLSTLTATTSGLFWFSIVKPHNKKLHYLQLLIIGLVLIHSAIPHKEYRFLFGIIPLWLSLTSINLHQRISHSNWHHHATKLTLLIITGVSVIGLLHQLPFQETAYPRHPLLTDPSMTLYKDLSKETTVCGLYDVTRQWVYTGGFSYIGKPIQLYSQEYQPKKDTYVNYLATVEPYQSDNASLVATYPAHSIYQNGQRQTLSEYYLYKLNRGCQTDPQYSPYRSFKPVEAALKTKPLTKYEF